jgi:hypothetical protein
MNPNLLNSIICMLHARYIHQPVLLFCPHIQNRLSSIQTDSQSNYPTRNCSLLNLALFTYIHRCKHVHRIPFQQQPQTDAQRPSPTPLQRSHDPPRLDPTSFLLLSAGSWPEPGTRHPRRSGLRQGTSLDRSVADDEGALAPRCAHAGQVGWRECEWAWEWSGSGWSGADEVEAMSEVDKGGSGCTVTVRC